MHACLFVVHCCDTESIRMQAGPGLVTRLGCSMLELAQVHSRSLANDKGVRTDKLGDRRTS